MFFILCSFNLFLFYLESQLIEKILSNIIFDFIIFFFDIIVNFGNKFHSASKNDVSSHNLFNDSFLDSFVYILIIRI